MEEYLEVNSTMESTIASVSHERSVSNGSVIDSTEIANTTNIPIDMQFNSGHIISISVYSVLFVLSAGGNITVLTAILRRKRPQEPLARMDLLLFHLAIADLMVAFLIMPLEIGWAATVEWKAGDFMCRIMSFFRTFGLYLSGFVVVCMAIDRYLAVRYPMHGLASTKRAKLMVFVAWILSTACSLPQVFIFHVESHPDFPWYLQCVTFNTFSNPLHELLYQYFGMVMMYALPFVLLVLLYGSIAGELCKISHTSDHTFASPDGLRRSGVNNIERAKVKSIKMTFVITAAFLVCWTPYYVMCVWFWTDPDTAKKVDQRIQKGLFLFACANSTVNPIVYGVFHMKFIFGANRMRSREMTTIRSSVTPLGRNRTQVITRDISRSQRTFQDGSGENETTQRSKLLSMQICPAANRERLALPKNTHFDTDNNKEGCQLMLLENIKETHDHKSCRTNSQLNSHCGSLC